MSCLENEVIYENCRERFWELMEGSYDLQCLIAEHFLSVQDQWKEKEFGFSEDPYDNAFDILWRYDSELLASDIEKCIEHYILNKPKQG